MSCSSRCADRSRRALLVGVLALLPWHARATLPPPELQAELPNARLQGQGRLRAFGFHIYDAALWTREPVAADATERSPLALELRYARKLRSAAIAERSIDEMKRLGDVTDAQAAQWRAALERLLPDVAAGDRITGVQHPGERTSFHVNGRAVGEVRDAAFTRLFFGIWLAPRTSQPALRAALLGPAGA